MDATFYALYPNKIEIVRPQKNEDKTIRPLPQMCIIGKNNATVTIMWGNYTEMAIALANAKIQTEEFAEMCKE